MLTDDQLAEARKTFQRWRDYYGDPNEGFLRFLEELVWTRDEEALTAEGEEAVKKFPTNKSYIRYMCEHVLNKRMVALPKSRRMMATWVMAAYCVWTAVFFDARTILWQSQTGAKSADTLENKMLFILEHIPLNRMAPWVEKNRGRVPKGWDKRLVNYWQADRDSNGLTGITILKRELVHSSDSGDVIDERLVDQSRILGVPEGKDQARQYTVSLGVLDEFAFFLKPRESLTGIRPAVGQSGKLFVVSSANPGYMAELIERPELAIGAEPPPQPTPPHEGIKTWQSRMGYFVFWLHYTADDEKTGPEWEEWPDDPEDDFKGAARRGYDRKQWQQEMEIDFSVHTGDAYYPEFSYNFHVQPNLRPIRGLPLIVGWDFGLTPAAVICQLTPDGHLLVHREVVMEENGILQAGEEAKRVLDTAFPWWRLTTRESDLFGFGDVSEQMIVSYVDPAGYQRAQTDMRTPVQILNQLGFNATGSVQDPAFRQESTKAALTKMIPHDGRSLPMLLISPECKTLIEALKGGAKIGKMRFKKEKNEFSHITEALEYVCAYLHHAKGRFYSSKSQMLGYKPHIQKKARL